MFVLPLRLDARQLKLLAEDLGELLERHVDFEDVPPRVAAGFALAAVGRLTWLADRIADFPSPCPTPPELFLP